MLSEWYKVVPASVKLEQGDILTGCLTLDIQDVAVNEIEPGTTIPARSVQRNMIVITQSCDLEDGNVEYVQLCPIHKLQDIPQLNSNNKRGLLKSDRMPRFALLDKNDRQVFYQDYLVVDLASVQSLPLEYVKMHAAKQGRRLRLVTPYREYLSQKFAYLFMRVGKPNPIRPFDD
jgi:hypothetical protein